MMRLRGLTFGFTNQICTAYDVLHNPQPTTHQSSETSELYVLTFPGIPGDSLKHIKGE